MPEAEETQQVVTLDDVREIVEEVARDAATSAVDDVREIVGDVARDAATSAVDSGATKLVDAANEIAVQAVEGSGTRVDDAAHDLAVMAADDAAAIVGERVASEVGALDVSQVTATISEEQWEYLQGAVRISLTSSVFSILLVAALLGTQVVGYLLDRWRS